MYTVIKSLKEVSIKWYSYCLKKSECVYILVTLLNIEFVTYWVDNILTENNKTNSGFIQEMVHYHILNDLKYNNLWKCYEISL
jgi:hypothetical protein